jgi:hypothetical protein
MGAQESDALYRVLQDMRRSAAPEAAMRTPGSDTTQNLIGANLLRSTGITPGPFGRMAAGLMGRVYGPMEDQTQGLLLRAMMDPQEGAGLLSMQIAKDPMLAEELRRRLLGLPAAGLLGGAVAQ